MVEKLAKNQKIHFISAIGRTIGMSFRPNEVLVAPIRKKQKEGLKSCKQLSYKDFFIQKKKANYSTVSLRILAIEVPNEVGSPGLLPGQRTWKFAR